jgi:hypothetical protein
MSCGVCLWAFSLAAQDLYVFSPATERAITIQRKLSEACPSITVSAFGRYNDFAAELEEGRPDAVVTLSATIAKHKAYTIRLTGIHGGRAQQPYVLCSIDHTVELGSIESTTIGTIDILGREGTEKFVSSFFGKTPKVKRVTKLEDLLPLLIFGMADAVLVCNQHVDCIRTLSKQNIMITPLPAPQTYSLVVAAQMGAEGEKVVAALSQLDSSALSVVGVEKWK